MELGLTLGSDASKILKEGSSPYTPQKSASTKTSCPGMGLGLGLGLGFCMDLRLGSPADGNQINPHKSQEQTDDEYEVDDADQASEEGDFNREGSESAATPPPLVQLNLLPFPFTPRQISPNFLSLSDNGSPENCSSGNNMFPAARELDVNRQPTSTAAMETNAAVLGFYGNTGGSGNLKIFPDLKRKYEGAASVNDMIAESEKTTSPRASDDDENGQNSRKKLRLSKQQSAFLEESFKEHQTLNPKQKLALAKQLNLRPRQVEVWFQNRRARTKLKQTEVDCEYLRRCCDTLTEENRRLHKELQELRALKASTNPFYPQLPATTLTMCPSCERVAPASASTAIDSSTKAAAFPVMKPPAFFPFPQTPNRPAASS